MTAKLNDQIQWNAKIEEAIEVESPQFTSALLDCTKDRAIGKCINSICQTLIPQLNKCFVDPEKASSVMNLIIASIVTPSFKSPLRASLMGQISAFALKRALQMNSNSLKLWRKELWEAFFDNSFLWMPKFYFSVMYDAFKLLSADPERFSDVLNRISASSTTSMFLSKDVEMLNKALMIRRLSFLTFCANFDAFRLQLPSLQEKLVELTKYYNGLILGEVIKGKNFAFILMFFRFSSWSVSCY